MGVCYTAVYPFLCFWEVLVSVGRDVCARPSWWNWRTLKTEFWRAAREKGLVSMRKQWFEWQQTPPLVTDTRDLGITLWNAKGTVLCEHVAVLGSELEWPVQWEFSSPHSSSLAETDSGRENVDQSQWNNLGMFSKATIPDGFIGLKNSYMKEHMDDLH